jgi:hypothetical protein
MEKALQALKKRVAEGKLKDRSKMERKLDLSSLSK